MTCFFRVTRLCGICHIPPNHVAQIPVPAKPYNTPRRDESTDWMRGWTNQGFTKKRVSRGEPRSSPEPLAGPKGFHSCQENGGGFDVAKLKIVCHIGLDKVPGCGTSCSGILFARFGTVARIWMHAV